MSKNTYAVWVGIPSSGKAGNNTIEQVISKNNKEEISGRLISERNQTMTPEF